ncbi:TadE/TadG family protein [Hoeflea sp. G2-23]|uniref:TadE/TadG family protein n=1 Tax=Hoeflea algicola TaxID=2983763 RepID=A0ABT3Z362_9HYPH|nr:TadE/TadG family type IV pilus assembly protein [Hoeflea algicola]MCY0146203.1 TadE/TadG family protein [Hoeflea algicola]
MARSIVKSSFRKFLRNRNGNFAMMAAITLPVLFMAGSLAVDTTNVMSMKTRLQDAVDSAALATATRLLQEKDLTAVEAKAFAEKFLDGQIEEDLSAFSNMSVKPIVTVLPVTLKNGVVWKVSISLVGTQSLTPMARMLGKDEMSVNVVGMAESGSESSKGSLSMALVLDKSGSMGWTMDGLIKMTVLKTAVTGLLTQFDLADPDMKFVRLGGVSYDTQVDSKQKLKWGTKSTGKFVAKLSAEGGTDSSDAFEWAYEQVTDNNEDKEHLKESGQVPTKYIVFMTDGDNNYNSADTSTKLLCNTAKKNGVIVYTVAFAAPTRGKELLSYCATSSAHFFDAKNSVELVAAFKNIGQQTSEVVSRLTQ